MTIIELLNKIANGEEVPKKVRYNDEIYDTKSINKFSLMIYEATGKMCDDGEVQLFLNDEVEILEEENKKCTVETCCIGIEGLSKALLKIKDDMKSIYENIDKVETLEEEKEIPKKIKDKYCSQISKVELAQKYNEIIDYLKSKGE